VESLGAINTEHWEKYIRVKRWIEWLANILVLPVFMRWGEHLIPHSKFMENKREQAERRLGTKGDPVYYQEIWPSVDSHPQFQYVGKEDDCCSKVGANTFATEIAKLIMLASSKSFVRCTGTIVAAARVAATGEEQASRLKEGAIQAVRKTNVL